MNTKPIESAPKAFLATVEELVKSYQRCDACGGYLHFTYMTDFTRNLTQETCRCPECATESKRTIHKLQ